MRKRIFLSGGGTLGSVMPLVALWERIGGDFECIWVGSRRGIEKAYVEGLGIKYRAIASAKFRRYLSLKTIFAPFLVFLGFLESVYALLCFRPRTIVVSGSFVSVPLVWAGRLLGVRIVVLQEDVKIGLAGRLTLPFADAAAFAFKETMEAAGGRNKIWIGNPVRKIFSAKGLPAIASKALQAGGSASGGQNPKGAEKWKNIRQPAEPLILVLGGGLGAQKINEEMATIAPRLNNRARILHLTGRDKIIRGRVADNYEQAEFLGDELAGAMAASDLIISRAGLSTLGEIAALGKPSILIPLPGVGQLENAEYFQKRKAAILLQEKDIGRLEKTILEILADGKERDKITENIRKIFPPNAAEKLASLIK